MKHIRSYSPGFTLIETMVYAALSVMIISLLYLAAAQYAVSARLNQQMLDRYTRLDTALDLCCQDLLRASSELIHWKKISPQELIWHDGPVDIGWRLDKKRFERVQGRYNQKSGLWIKKHKGLAVDHVSTVRFTVKHDSTRSGAPIIALVGVEVSLEGLKVTGSRVVAPRNG